jgi:proteasome assembly chaperone (PAC2) family protein
MEINFNKIKLNKPIVFIGLPGIGLVGKIAVDTIVKKTKAKKVGTIRGDFFPPMVFVNEQSKIQESCDEIYYLNSGKQDFIFISGDFQPSLDSIDSFPLHYKFAKELANFIKSINAKEVYSIAGINVGDTRITKEPELFYASNKFVKEELKKKLKPTKNTTISGIAGLILSETEKFNIPATCILGETSAKIYGDFESAKSILIYMQEKFKIKFDMKEVEEEAKKISNAFKQVVKELKKATESSIVQDNHKPTYIR